MGRNPVFGNNIDSTNVPYNSQSVDIHLSYIKNKVVSTKKALESCLKSKPYNEDYIDHILKNAIYNLKELEEII